MQPGKISLTNPGPVRWTAAIDGWTEPNLPVHQKERLPYGNLSLNCYFFFLKIRLRNSRMFITSRKTATIPMTSSTAQYLPMMLMRMAANLAARPYSINAKPKRNNP